MRSAANQLFKTTGLTRLAKESAGGATGAAEPEAEASSARYASGLVQFRRSNISERMTHGQPSAAALWITAVSRARNSVRVMLTPCLLGSVPEQTFDRTSECPWTGLIVKPVNNLLYICKTPNLRSWNSPCTITTSRSGYSGLVPGC